MNAKASRLFTLTFATGIALVFVARTQAASVVGSVEKPKVATGVKVVERRSVVIEAKAGPVGLLARAYGTLAEADHDYKGHRADAMRQIEDAGKELGENLRGDGHDHEPQGISDEHLREAQNLLAQAKGSLSGKALKHVNAAERQLTIALKIK